MAVLGLVLGGILPSAVAASADPITDKRAQADQLAKQIDQLNTRGEQLAERYNAARLAADAVRAQVDKAAAGVADSAKRLDQHKSQLRDVAVRSYIAGGSVQTTASSAAGGDMAVQRFYVQSMTSDQRDAMDALRQSQLDYAAQREQLKTAQASAQAAVNQVAKDRQAAADADAQAQAALGKVKGELAALVAQRQAEEEAAAAARAREEMARQQAMEAARSKARAEADAAAAASRAAQDAVAPASRSVPRLSSPPSGHGAGDAIAEAQRQIGKPYQWGAAGPDSFDCSGLTMWAWRAGGVSLPHYTRAQYDATTHVSLSDLQPGDLVFFGSDFHHEGLYVGGGQMIEAPHSGANVRYASIYRSDLIAASRP
ncbi:MAG: peptidoglycan DL-endopeptidase CwlO [Acidimicrobiaceae bacterium]|jgi:cell wall-associated NlpC family hydrolase|nr:peptidoglycan DL-endopeptidase CwlO [Acidimicrobiaceae bacterium]